MLRAFDELDLCLWDELSHSREERAARERRIVFGAEDERWAANGR